ncbi:hypothetical protein [Acidovorax sp. A1169]|uniref:hypothetical protein n=1 Tax=Acidovorax sp. A1169 TaxID=3059524 RepID=UPI002737A225|nr:hypothetical protein [Acidovorax sp. A1169]MDP4074335.1 hypothetical protein [Acidovorax sp. A1169]
MAIRQYRVQRQGSVVAQFLLLGATMAVLYRMRERLVGNGRFMGRQSRIPGVILIALGLRLAAQQR